MSKEKFSVIHHLLVGVIYHKMMIYCPKNSPGGGFSRLRLQYEGPVCARMFMEKTVPDEGFTLYILLRRDVYIPHSRITKTCEQVGDTTTFPMRCMIIIWCKRY